MKMGPKLGESEGDWNGIWSFFFIKINKIDIGSNFSLKAISCRFHRNMQRGTGVQI